MTEEELKLLKKQWKKQENLKPTIFYSEDYVKELQERIDKAIEQLEELKNLYDDNYTISDKAENIINILKRDDK